MQKWLKLSFPNASKFFRSDNAHECTQYAFQAVLHSYDTVHQLTCSSTSQQNGRVERKLHHILDIVRALLLSVEVPALFWGEVALYVVHAINHIPSPVIQIKLHISAFLGHLQTITTFAPSVLLVSFFFSHMSITNLSLSQGFVVFLAMAKLKRGIGVMILSLIIFVSPVMLSFRNITPLSSSLTSVPPYLPHLS